MCFDIFKQEVEIYRELKNDIRIRVNMPIWL